MLSHSDRTSQGSVDSGVCCELGWNGMPTSGAGLLALIDPPVEAAQAEVVLTRGLQYHFSSQTVHHGLVQASQFVGVLAGAGHKLRFVLLKSVRLILMQLFCREQFT